MDGGVIFIIVFVIIIALAGLGVGLYFWLRDDGSGGSTNPVNPNTPRFPSIQQGNKIVPVGYSGAANIGSSVAVSEDGNTMVIGASQDNEGIGGIWIYTRSNGVWSAQTTKIVPSDYSGTPNFGAYVGIDSTGDGIVVGGPMDGTYGAVWFFTRNSSSIWTQVGNKITPSDATSGALFGTSVGVNDDDYTYAVIGAPGDSGGVGATYIFKRTDTTWTQQGNKLVGTGYVGTPAQGTSVRISDDGTAFITGGPNNDSGKGACWVFTRATGEETWAQAGNRILPTGTVGSSAFGTSVAISGTEGNTLAVSGPNDNSNVGAVWTFYRSGNNIIQSGDKIVASGLVGTAHFGNSVRLSNDGRTMFIGSYTNNSNVGGAFSYTRNDLLTWEQQAYVLGKDASGAAQQGFSISLSADGFTGVLGCPQDSSGIGCIYVFIYNLG